MCLMEPLWLLGETGLVRSLLEAPTAEELASIPAVSDEFYIARAQLELKLGQVAAAEASLQALTELGGSDMERVRVRARQARAELALAQGDVAEALRRLPPDETNGMNEEMRVRGLALRVLAEMRLGDLAATTVAAVQDALAGPPRHHVAALELHAALAAAARAGVGGVPADARRRHADHVAVLAASLAGHPVQQRAFVDAWGREPAPGLAA